MLMLTECDFFKAENIEGSGVGDSSLLYGRYIYCSLLKLCFLCNLASLTSDRDKAEKSASIEGSLLVEYPFDRVFRDATRCVCSTEDFATLKSTEKSLLQAVADRDTQVVRIAFGFLF